MLTDEEIVLFDKAALALLPVTFDRFINKGMEVNKGLEYCCLLAAQFLKHRNEVLKMLEKERNESSEQASETSNNKAG
jgi:hypothetical protein